MLTKPLNHLTKDKEVMSLLGLTALILLAMAFINPGSFYTVENFQSMGIQFAEFGILSFGMMLAMISGGIDLSLIGIANLSGIVSVMMMKQVEDGPIALVVGIVISLAVGALCGLFNGLLIGGLQIPAMLVTLSGLQLYTGIGLILTRGPAITGVPSVYSGLANGSWFMIPIAVIIFAVVVAIVSYVLNYTVYGSHLRFMGTNPTTSRYSGINNFKVTVKTYVFSGVLGSVAGILMTSHYNSAKTDYGLSYTLLSLLIVVMGGTDPNGGKGKVAGVTLSIIILQLISSAFNILRINAFIKTFVWGIVLILVMIGMRYLQKDRMRK